MLFLAGVGIFAAVQVSAAQSRDAAAASDTRTSMDASASAAVKKASSDAFWAGVAEQNAKQYASQRAEASAFNAQADQDRRAALNGWATLEEGPAGMYWAPPVNGYDCVGEAGPCQKFMLTVTMPCPGGVYVEAGVYSGGVAIGRTNDWTAALKAGDQALITLVDTSRKSYSIKVTRAVCH